MSCMFCTTPTGRRSTPDCRTTRISASSSSAWKGVLKPLALAGIAFAAVAGFLHWVVEGPNEVQPEDEAEAQQLLQHPERSAMSYPPGTLIRNTTATRINHWITAACFVLLMLSGLSMFHPMLFFLSGLFGGGQWTRAIHPWIGIVLLISYAGLIVQFWRDNLWSRDDVAWMRVHRPRLGE